MLLRIPWTTRSNHSMLKEISPEYPLEGLMVKLKLQYFGHLIRGTFSVAKTLMLEKIEGKRRREWQRMRWLDSISDSVDMNLIKLQEIVKDRESWHAGVHGVTKSWTWFSNWATISISSSKACGFFLHHQSASLPASSIFKNPCDYMVHLDNSG